VLHLVSLTRHLTRSSEVTCIIVEALWNWSSTSYYRY